MPRFPLVRSRLEAEPARLSSLASACGLGAVTGALSGLPHPLPLVLAGLWALGAARLGVVARRLRSDSNRIGIGDDRVSDHDGHAWRTVHFDETVRVVARGRALVVASADAEVALPVWRFLEPRELVAFVRARVPRHAWQLTPREESQLLSWRREVAPHPQGRLPASASAGYRTTAAPRRIRLHDVLPASAVRWPDRSTLRAYLPWAAGAIQAIHGALVGPVWLLALLLGLPGSYYVGQLVVWTLRHRWRVRAQDAAHRASLLGWLGEDAVVDAEGWTSLDGRRRVRFHDADLGDRLEGPHLHFEELDEDGTTLASYSTTVGEEWRVECAPKERVLAWLATPCSSARMFLGHPAPFGSPTAQGERITSVVLETYAEGFVVRRFDAEGTQRGDTFHVDRAGAMRQLELELGARDLAWTALVVERDAPWWHVLERRPDGARATPS